MTSTWHFLGLAIEADWLEAWATAAGGVGTLATLIYAARGLAQERTTRRAEMERLRGEARSAQQAQARSVVIHDPQIDYKDPIPDSSQIGEPRVFRATLGNYGEYPITHVSASIGLPELAVAAFPKWIPVVRAGESVILEWPLLPHGERAGEGLRDLGDAKRYAVKIVFADVHGTSWEGGNYKVATESG